MMEKPLDECIATDARRVEIEGAADERDTAVPELDDVEDAFQAENAGSSLDQPSDQSS